MSMLDNLKDKARDTMNDPSKKARIEKIAKEKGISAEEVKAKFAGNKHI